MPGLKLGYTCIRCRAVLTRKRGDTLKDGQAIYFEDCPKCGFRNRGMDPWDNTKWKYGTIVEE